MKTWLWMGKEAVVEEWYIVRRGKLGSAYT